jgi:hypothetical protein
MTQAFVQKTAKFTASAANSVTSAALTTTSGNHSIVTVSNWRTGAATVTVTDSKSNSYTNDQALTQGDSRATISSALNITGGSSHTVTATSSSGASDTYFEGNFTEFSGTLSSAALDKTGSIGHGSGTTTSTVSTGTNTTQADELVIVCIAVNSNDTTINITDPPSGYTSIGVNQDGNATIGYEAAYKIITATGTQTATWTFDSTTSDGDAAVIATYKSATGGPPVITSTPVSQANTAGNTVTFNVSATGTGTLHYQWKTRPTFGDTYTNVGTDSSSYTTGTLVNGDNYKHVKCTVSDDNGSTDTEPEVFIWIKNLAITGKGAKLASISHP